MLIIINLSLSFFFILLQNLWTNQWVDAHSDYHYYLCGIFGFSFADFIFQFAFYFKVLSFSFWQFMWTSIYLLLVLCFVCVYMVWFQVVKHLVFSLWPLILFVYLWHFSVCFPSLLVVNFLFISFLLLLSFKNILLCASLFSFIIKHIFSIVLIYYRSFLHSVIIISWPAVGSPRMFYFHSFYF